MTVLNSGMTKIAAVAVALFTLAGCATTPNTFANVDRSVDFTQYTTYGFPAHLATDDRGYESLHSNYLKSAVGHELESRGLKYSNDPELLVDFYIDTKEKLRSRAVPTMGVGVGFYDPWYDTWGTYGGYRTEITQITEGTLQIDVIDAADHKLVWEGRAKGRITDKAVKNLEKTIDESVHAIMGGFPITPGA